MEHVYADGLIDWITGETFGIPSSQNMNPVAYRAKMKEGERTLLVSPFSSIVWAIDYGLGNGLSRDVVDGVSCGEHIVLYMYPGSNTFRSPLRLFPSVFTELSEFFSQFEVVYDPLPEWVELASTNTTITIDSEKFTAPSGLFDRADASRFYFDGSTFLEGPRMFSGLAMRETEIYPIGGNSSISYDPFRDCPSIESIAYQGDLENVLAISSIDLTYQDDDGNDVFDAYPEGGAPVSIHRYIQSHGNPITMNTRFPKFDTSRLQYLNGHLALGDIQFTGTPTLPFGGLDFTDAKMLRNLELPDLQFTTENSFAVEGATFTWASLGVSAPSDGVLQWVSGLWDIYQILPEPIALGEDIFEFTAPMIIPGSTASGINSQWVQQLESAADVLNVDENFVPNVPSTVSTINGYYRKHISGEGSPSKDADFYDHAVSQTYKEEDDNFIFAVPRLHEGVKQLNGYVDNLYAYQVIDDDIFVPSMPSTVEIVRDAYRRAFYNSKGAVQEIEGANIAPTVVVAWSEGRKSRGDTAITVVVNPPQEPEEDDNNAWYRIYQKGQEVDGGFWADKSESSSGPWTRLYRDTNTPFSPEFVNVDGREVIHNGPGNLPAYLDMIEELYKVEQVKSYTRIIQHDIVLEHGVYNELQYSGNFQQETFFGAFVNPENVDMYIPLQQSSEWGAYNNTGIYRTVYNSVGGQNWSYSGRFWVDKDGMAISLFPVNFVAFAVYANYEEGTFDSFLHSFDSIKYSGSPRIAGERVLKPYDGAFSGSLDGDLAAFRAYHGIEQTEDNVGWSSETPSPSSGLPIVLNTSREVKTQEPWILDWDVYESVPYGSRYPNDNRADSQPQEIADYGQYVEEYMNEHITVPRRDLVQRDIEWSDVPTDGSGGSRDVQQAMIDRAEGNYNSVEDMIDSFNRYFEYDQPLVLYPEDVRNMYGYRLHIESQADIDNYNNREW